jgi:hypothetical protein
LSAPLVSPAAPSSAREHVLDRLSAFGEPFENAVYACHDYARAGMAFGGPYDGDRDALEAAFLNRTGSSCTRATVPAGRCGRTRTSGLQGLVYAAPDMPYMRRFGDFIDRRRRLGVDSWGSTDRELADVVEPVHALIAGEFPSWAPQAMLPEYAALFRGLSDEQLAELAGSISLASCVRRERLCELLAAQRPEAATR